MAAQPSVLLTPAQEHVVDLLVDWWDRVPTLYRYGEPPIFRLAGYAGVGKSTVLKTAIEALGLPVEAVAYVTFTGKAALVLQNKGMFAQTIHRLIYVPLLSSYTDPFTRTKKQRVAGFELRTELDPAIQVLVIDEVSMVSPKLLRDLLSFGLPIIAVGDPAQLPPVRGEDNGLLLRPDAFLKDIHRQAADNPILWASMLAREGKTIPYGKHGGTLEVVPMGLVDPARAVNADQVIVCTNNTRRIWNRNIRAAFGYDGLPQVGEKLICLKNNWEEVANGTPLVNGLICRLDTPPKQVSRNLRTFFANLSIDGDPTAKFYDLEINLDYFEPIPEREANTDGKYNHFDYGSAITCHKSQGSEYDDVVFICDAFGDADNKRRLLYTGITRAAKYLQLAV